MHDIKTDFSKYGLDLLSDIKVTVLELWSSFMKWIASKKLRKANHFDTV